MSGQSGAAARGVTELGAAARGRTRAAASAVRTAFAATPYPGDAAIATRGTVVPFELDLEAQAIEAFFAGRPWQDVTLSALVEKYEGDHSACLIFMTPAAFRFYLPSYMLICLDQFEAADMVVPTTLHLLGPDAPLPGMEEESARAFHERVAPFAPAERRAVAGFLLAMQQAYGDILPETDSPAIPLHRFWGQYLDAADRNLVGAVPEDALARMRDLTAAMMREQGTGGA